MPPWAVRGIALPFFFLQMVCGVSLARQFKPEEQKPTAVLKVKQTPQVIHSLLFLMCLVYLFAFPYLRVFKDRSVDGVVRII
jgi:hypothetical protein